MVKILLYQVKVLATIRRRSFLKKYFFFFWSLPSAHWRSDHKLELKHYTWLLSEKRTEHKVQLQFKALFCFILFCLLFAHLCVVFFMRRRFKTAVFKSLSCQWRPHGVAWGGYRYPLKIAGCTTGYTPEHLTPPSPPCWPLTSDCSCWFHKGTAFFNNKCILFCRHFSDMTEVNAAHDHRL